MRSIALIVVTILLHPPSGLGEERYFPDGSLGREPRLHTSRHTWYANALKAFGEPSLMRAVEKGATQGRTIYRFTWLRSFDRPVCITLDRGESVSLTVKVLDGKGGYELGKVTVNKTSQITQEQVARFQQLLQEAGYRVMSPRATGDHAWYWSAAHNTWLQKHSSGLDGAQWILEYCSGVEYFFVDRWSASKSPFGEACLYLVELSGIDVGDIY
jgi:hypothetical protein